MDPIGFALDAFDTVGRHRGTDDWGFPLDTAVSWTLIDKGKSQEIPFDSLRTMSAAFVDLPQATNCVTKQVFRFATGREETAADDAALAGLTQEFISDGRRLKGFLLHFVGTDAFRKAAPTSDAEAPAPTMSQVVENVFTPACGSCHVAAGLGGLSLAGDDGLLARLLGASLGLPTMPLVTPGRPSDSYLWHKVVGTHTDIGGSGSRMPPTEPLHTAELDLLRAWILSLDSSQMGGAK
jgi:mono/diheme cytochrome c family protein